MNIIRYFYRWLRIRLFCAKTNSKIKSVDVEITALKFNNYNITNSVSIDKFCSVGRNTYIGPYTTITKATIGHYCQIGEGVVIGPGEHRVDNISLNTEFYDNIYATLTKKDIVIGNDVWIGTKAIIMRGVTIGNGVVIGAATVVTKDLDNYGIYVGNPARLIRYRFEDEKIQDIQKSRWWELEYCEASKVVKKLGEMEYD